MSLESNKILSKHIIPQPLILEDDNYILNEQYIESNYATSDINGYMNTKIIESHYKAINETNDITNYLDSYYYIPSIGELGIAFQNINKINQNGAINYLDIQNENIYLSSTLKNSQNNIFWAFNNQNGTILPKSEIENQDNINTTSLLFKKFEIDILNDSQINNSFNEENINYVDRFTDDNIEVLSYMYYVNYNSTNLENNKNAKYYYMQYRLAYTYLDKEPEPIFSYLEYGNNLINDYSLNNMSYIYDKYELTWNKTKNCLEYNNSNIHDNFFDIKNPPTGSYIYPISYNINKINNQQNVTININPYCQYYINQKYYLDPYGFKFYFVFPFEYIFNKIRSNFFNKKVNFQPINMPDEEYSLNRIIINELTVDNPILKYINNTSNNNPWLFGISLELTQDMKTALKGWNSGSRNPNGQSGRVISQNERTIKYWYFTSGKNSARATWINRYQNNITKIFDFKYFEYPFRFNEILLYTLFTKNEINDLNIEINYQNCSLQNNYYDSPTYEIYYDKVKLNYTHGKIIRQYIIDHYLCSNQKENEIGIDKPIITSMEQFLDLLGSIFYKHTWNDSTWYDLDQAFGKFYNSIYISSEESYIYDNIFNYLYYYNNPKVFMHNEVDYLDYNKFTNNDKTSYCDVNRKRFYNISPIKFFDENGKIGYVYNNILALYMKFNYKDNTFNENYYALKYFTKDSLVFFCKKINLTLEKSINNIKSITFSLVFLSKTNSNNVFTSFTIIPNMTFNIYFDKKHLYNLCLTNINSNETLSNIISCANKPFFNEYVTSNNIDANNTTYYITLDDLQYNNYLSGFSNINNLLLENSNRYNAETPKITTSSNFNIIRNRINSLANYYGANYGEHPISHKVASKDNTDSKTYYYVNNLNKITFEYDYTDIDNKGIYQTYYIDNILNNTNLLDNSNFAKEFINLPEVNSKYFKDISLNSINDQNLLYAVRIWGHRTINNIYDDFTIYKPIEKSHKISMPLFGYKEVLYVYNKLNKEVINYLLSDYIIIINKSLSSKEIQFTDNDKLSGLHDDKSFKLILNPLEIKILYPAVYNCNYSININCNNIFIKDFTNVINDIKKNNDMATQDLIYITIQKLIKLINFDVNRINNYSNILIKLNNTDIDQLIYNIFLYDILNNNDEIHENEGIINIKHCQNPYKGNLIIIKEDKK